MADDVAALARELALPYYEDALPAHDVFHAKRVRDVAVRMAEECAGSVDLEVLSAAAWLHDIGRPLERTGEIDDHDAWAAREAADLLAAEGLAADTVHAITHCIRAHSIRASSPEPETIEAKLCFDADKLDAAGARGIVRLACIVGERSGRSRERHAVIDEASPRDLAPSGLPDVELLQEWARERLDLLYTEPAERIGERRWTFMEEFFAAFDRELGVEPTG